MQIRKIFILLIISILCTFSACSLSKAVQMVQCDYSFQKVTTVSWAGLNFMNLRSDRSNWDMRTLAKCAQAAANKDFTINIGVTLSAHNPTQRSTEIAGFDYLVYYQGKQIATGQSTNSTDIVIPAGNSCTIPLNFHLNLADVIQLSSLQAIDETLHFLDEVKKIGKNQTDFSLKVRPHFRVGNNIMKGVYIPISSI